ncbi:MAG: hypothetical protein GX496_09845 [Firmicutes bacterium]|nr:hypothetical protein [Bacillota bacterium]
MERQAPLHAPQPQVSLAHVFRLGGGVRSDGECFLGPVDGESDIAPVASRTEYLARPGLASGGAHIVHRRDPGLAAVLSFFAWGLGYIYLGRFWAGFALVALEALFVGVTWFSAATAGLLPLIRPYLSAQDAAWAEEAAGWFLVACLVLSAAIWVAQVVGAYRAAVAENERGEWLLDLQRRQEAEIARLQAAMRRDQGM